MSNRKLAFVYSPAVEALSYPPDCPFKTLRPTLTRARLISLGLLDPAGGQEFPARRATLNELRRIHAAEYLEELQLAARGDLSPTGFQMGLGGQDTPVFKDMFDYGAWACGAGLVAVELLTSGRTDVAFNLLGGFHHAGAARAAGFCFLNDVALTCDAVARAGKRVVYLDVDAHHGDGVQEIFYERKDVFTISLHESGNTLFPWGGFENETGRGAGLGYNANIPLPAGTYDEAFLTAFERAALPLIRAYEPDVIVLELGMDTLAGDPLTHLQMTNNIVVELFEVLLAQGCPLLVAGGGGYHVEHTVRAWTLAWRTCLGGAEDDAASLGLGGVMLGSSEWAGGLRDRHLPPTPAQQAAVEAELERTLTRVRSNLFPLHGLTPTAPPTEGRELTTHFC